MCLIDLAEEDLHAAIDEVIAKYDELDIGTETMYESDFNNNFTIITITIAESNED